jgi:hypothetical protein
VIGHSLRPTRRAAVLAILFCLAGCIAEDTEYYGPYKLEKMSKVERTDCLAKGGEVYVGGIFPTELCALPTPDAGKSCKRAADCEGFCQSSTQTCSSSYMGSGCYDYLNEEGEPGSICID